MIKEFIGKGKTVEEATAAAKAGLNAPALASINVEVIQMPKKKTLGLFGGHDAEVRAWFDDGKSEKKPQPKKAPAKKTETKPQAKKAAPKAEAPAESAPKAEKANAEITQADAQVAVDYLKAILNGFGITDAVVNAQVNDGVIETEIECDDYGIIIGRRGETLDSLQYLTSLAVKKSCDKYVRVTVNVGNYREKRMETLIFL